jgi:hypothetical protein
VREAKIDIVEFEPFYNNQDLVAPMAMILWEWFFPQRKI